MTTAEQLVTIDIDQGVAVLTWNRPERNNAWSIPMELEYFDLLRQCEANDDVRVIVVTGAGRAFCPGMDTTALSDQAKGGPSTFPHLRQPMTLPRTINKPIIAAVNGACAGIGFIAAMNCDMRFASNKAKFTTSFTQRGIMAEHGLAWTLPRMIGMSRAFDLLVSARVVQGQEALDLGIVDRLFDPEKLMDETLAYARTIAATVSPVAMGVTKRQIYAAQESTQEEARTLAIRYWYDVLRPHSDFKEGIESYLEKRPPAFAPWDPDTTADPAPLPDDYVRG